MLLVLKEGNITFYSLTNFKSSLFLFSSLSDSDLDLRLVLGHQPIKERKKKTTATNVLIGSHDDDFNRQMPLHCSTQIDRFTEQTRRRNLIVQFEIDFSLRRDSTSCDNSRLVVMSNRSLRSDTSYCYRHTCQWKTFSPLFLLQKYHICRSAISGSWTLSHRSNRKICFFPKTKRLMKSNRCRCYWPKYWTNSLDELNLCSVASFFVVLVQAEIGDWMNRSVVAMNSGAAVAPSPM